MNSVRPIMTAVIGLGRAGWDIHVRMLRDRSDYRIVEVVDVMPERLKEARSELGCRTFRDFKEFLQASEAELVV